MLKSGRDIPGCVGEHYPVEKCQLEALARGGSMSSTYCCAVNVLTANKGDSGWLMDSLDGSNHTA